MASYRGGAPSGSTFAGAITERGRRLGASVLLESREGPAGWSSVLRSKVGGEIALWQPKRRLVRGTA